MQTFLPYADFRRSAEALDERRLGKQRVEVLQVLRALELEEYGWRHHPAVRMWQGCTPSLVAYGLACVARWTALGHTDTTERLLREFLQRPAGMDLPRPPWLGDPALHRSHRLALYRKDPELYGPRFPDVVRRPGWRRAGSSADDASVYVWPDPPAPARELEPWSAWVIRPLQGWDGQVVAVAAPPPGTRADTKPRRTVARFVEVVAVGDAVVEALPLPPGPAPESQRLRVGRISGSALLRASDAVHTRTVAWEGELRRGDLRRPAQLQDPRPFFALRGEPVLE